jgi:hypothetical protein
MPTNKDFKRLIRQRMAATGERYTHARDALVEAPPGVNVDRTARWVELLADPQQNLGAFELLKALPAPQLQRLAIAGTRHADARVRRRCCRLLDDLALTDESIAALEVCATDADPRVRQAALHTLSCEHCKPDGVCLDQRMIAERAASDPSAKVRRGIVATLAWNPALSDEWAVALATRFLDDASAENRRYARVALDRIDRQRRTDEQRRQLPEPLRTKTERHPGKWVAIIDGAIVSVDPPPSWRRRRPDAQLYFVSRSEPAAASEVQR